MRNFWLEKINHRKAFGNWQNYFGESILAGNYSIFHQFKIMQNFNMAYCASRENLLFHEKEEKNELKSHETIVNAPQNDQYNITISTTDI